MVLVRLLLFLALATIVVATVMYLFKKDRRYLRFIEVYEGASVPA